MDKYFKYKYEVELLDFFEATLSFKQFEKQCIKYNEYNIKCECETADCECDLWVPCEYIDSHYYNVLKELAVYEADRNVSKVAITIYPLWECGSYPYVLGIIKYYDNGYTFIISPIQIDFKLKKLFK